MGPKFLVLSDKMNYLNKLRYYYLNWEFVPNIFFGDGYKVCKLCSLDSIIVTAGAPFIPQALMAQLKNRR
jgi:protein-L-isoaspartate O-methyltransferase